MNYRFAQERGGCFLLRIEDIDGMRCRPEFMEGIYEDLAWLGLTWQQPVRRQSEHMADYEAALDQLKTQELLYPCFCTRAEIAAEIAGSGAAPHGPEGVLYPGRCKHLSAGQQAERMASGAPYALRLHTDRAIAKAGPLIWYEERAGEMDADPACLGDVVLARKETPASYHLCVTLDDALQGVSHVIRGEDLFHATHMHRLLQALLGLPTPQYHHHPLLLDQKGQRLAKRAGATTLQQRRAQGATAQALLQELGLLH